MRNIFERNHVCHISLTGSFARGDATETSDIDIIYSKAPGQSITLFNIGDMKFALESHFSRKVDLISETAIRPELRANILSVKTPVF